MLEGKYIGAVILMGGEGRRFGTPIPKQFQSLKNKKLYRFALDTFLSCQMFDEIVLVCHPDWLAEVAQETPQVKIVAGGETRQKSSFLGLKAFSAPPNIVSIHDAVRPFVSRKIIKENVSQALVHGAVNTCIPSADTLVFCENKPLISAIPKRELFLRGQTPQTFRYDWILEAHLAAAQEGIKEATDDCQLILRQGRPVYIVQGSENNIKITTSFDFALAKTLSENTQFTESTLNCTPALTTE